MENNYEQLFIKAKLTRCYFSFWQEVGARILAIMAYLLFLFVAIINSGSLAKILATLLPFPTIFDQYGVADGFFRAITILLFNGTFLFSLFLGLPLILSRTLKSLRKLGKIYCFGGIVNLFLGLPLTVICWKYFSVANNLLAIILVTVCCFLMIISGIMMWVFAKKRYQKIIKAISVSLQLK